MYSSFKKQQILTESWRKFLLENDGSETLDDLFSKSPSGRERPSWINEELKESELSELISKLDEDRIRLFFKRHVNYSPETFNSMDELDKAICTSIILFTGGNVASVRDPEKFKDDIEQKPIDIYDPRTRTNKRFLDSATKYQYQVANHVINTMANMKNEKISGDVYRGMMLSMTTFKKQISVGKTFGGSTITSWSTSSDVASEYTTKTLIGIPEGDIASVYFEMTAPKYGTYIGDFSVFRREYEFIIGKPIVIEQIREVRSPTKTPDGKNRFSFIVTCRVAESASSSGSFIKNLWNRITGN